MSIIVYYQDEEDLKAKLTEAVRILFYLRRSTKTWEEVFGFDAKNKKKQWEGKADDFLAGLLKEHKLYGSEKIKIEEQCQEQQGNSSNH